MTTRFVTIVTVDNVTTNYAIAADDFSQAKIISPKEACQLRDSGMRFMTGRGGGPFDPTAFGAISA